MRLFVGETKLAAVFELKVMPKLYPVAFRVAELSNTGGWPRSVPSLPVIGSVVVLAVVCSALAFVVMFALVAEIGPIRMTAITYVNPAVAVIAGAIVLSEPITIWTIIGFVLILVGCALVTRPDRRRADVEAPLAPS